MEPNRTKKTSKILSLLMLTIVPVVLAAGLLYGIPRYYYDIADRIKLANYSPSAEISDLAQEAHMTEKGQKIFYVHDPQISNKKSFNDSCPFPELTFVLGCYTGNNIYVLDIENSELESAEPVTAAHEMLHAAYTRLSPDEKKRIDVLVQDQFEKANDPRLIDLVDQYRQHDTDAIPTELHSIIGTEVDKLSPALEKYYAQYFTNRQAVVNDFVGYESVFSTLEKKIETLKNQMESDKSEIKDIEQDIDSQSKQISEINKELQNLENSNNIEAYNAKVPEQNSLVNAYNTNIRKYRQLIRSYNSKVKQVNDISVRHDELLNSINSKFQEIDG